jgi:hypothetical protein
MPHIPSELNAARTAARLSRLTLTDRRGQLQLLGALRS